MASQKTEDRTSLKIKSESFLIILKTTWIKSSKWKKKCIFTKKRRSNILYCVFVVSKKNNRDGVRLIHTLRIKERRGSVTRISMWNTKNWERSMSWMDSWRGHRRVITLVMIISKGIFLTLVLTGSCDQNQKRYFGGNIQENPLSMKNLQVVLWTLFILCFRDWTTCIMIYIHITLYDACDFLRLHLK